jgi:glycosyltransferase involved in cell wall biosynthesis
MKIVFIADGRSDNFRRFVSYFALTDDTVHVLSTYDCQPIENFILKIIPSFLKGPDFLVKKVSKEKQHGKDNIIHRILSYLFKTKLIEWIFFSWGILKTINLPIQYWFTKRYLDQVNPEIVVAFRLQNEGYLAALCNRHPWVLFTQGSDFVYWLNKNRLHGWLTSMSIRRVDGLLSDCERDIRLAKSYGLSLKSKVGIYPGNGGVDLSIFSAGSPAVFRQRLVVCPRSPAPYIRINTLAKSIKNIQLIPEYKDVKFVLLSAESAIATLNHVLKQHCLDSTRIQTVSFLPRADLAKLFKQAAIIVSPSVSDGTPNSMLEAMACGAFPIMSNLDSIREWITHGQNGFLFNPESPLELTDCIKLALEDSELRNRSQVTNLSIIQRRADYKMVMPEIRNFLASVITGKSPEETEATVGELDEVETFFESKNSGCQQM